MRGMRLSDTFRKPEQAIFLRSVGEMLERMSVSCATIRSGSATDRALTSSEVQP